MIDELLRGEQIGETAEDRKRRCAGEHRGQAPPAEDRAAGEHADDPRHAEEDRHCYRLLFLVEQRLGRGVVPRLRPVDRRREGIRPALGEGLAAAGILGRAAAPSERQGQGDEQTADDDRGGVFMESAAAGNTSLVRHRIDSGKMGS